jgi:L-alanine-DL-glutamate epimerase-like enolase superfamily enzyme
LYKNEYDSMNTEITEIFFEPLDLDLTEPFGISGGAQQKAENVLIKLKLANGITGIGEAAPFPAVSGETQYGTISALKGISEYLKGKKVNEWSKISRSLYEIDPYAAAARCGIEMALMDAFCKTYNLPLYVLFGGEYTTLETDMTIPMGSVKHAEASAMAILNRGIKIIKIKTGSGDLNLDIERVKAVHKAAPGSPILIDGNCGYSTEDAFNFLKELKAYDIKPTLFEQPVSRDNWEGMEMITLESGILIAADESARNAEDILKIVKWGAAHVVNIKLMKSGFVEAIRMVNIAKAAGLQLMIGGMVESILAMTYSANFAIGNGGFGFIDLDTPMFIREHPFKGGFTQNGAIISIDKNQTGHGVELA